MLRKYIFLLLLAGRMAFFVNAESEAARDGMILVDGGTFRMGYDRGDSFEHPVHTVSLSSFYICPYEVTQGLWQQVMSGTINHLRAKMKPAGKLKGEGWTHPVYFVTWEDAIEFCNKLSSMNGLEPCYSGSGNNITCDFSANGYRLPTEAEWEYAARGGIDARGYLYAGASNLENIAWYLYNSMAHAWEVGMKSPNELGLYDMSGNVYEWCWDRFGLYPKEEQQDPTGNSRMNYRVFRGGSWSHDAEYNRVTFRMAYPPETRMNNLGFRIVRRASEGADS